MAAKLIAPARTRGAMTCGTLRGSLTLGTYTSGTLAGARARDKAMS